MLLHIPTILSRTQATSMQERLAAANWTDGRETVGPQGAQVKHNLQLPETSPLRQELGHEILMHWHAAHCTLLQHYRYAHCHHVSTATKKTTNTDFTLTAQ